MSGRALSRRAALGGALAVCFGSPPLRAVETPNIALEYHAGRLSWPGGSARAAIGRSGVTALKEEGDGATPSGIFGLSFGLYRADRLKIPATALAMIAMKEGSAWVDDPRDSRYNTLVDLPYPAHVERLWRGDGIYDVLIVVDYNMRPVTPGLGSAIFLHIARPNFSPTVGCVAVSRETLLLLLRELGPGSTLTIRA